jgi:hypothetical protein
VTTASGKETAGRHGGRELIKPVSHSRSPQPRRLRTGGSDAPQFFHRRGRFAKVGKTARIISRGVSLIAAGAPMLARRRP